LAIDCIIVGGGIIGLLTARELSNSGLKVIVLERGEIGRESSWAGGGILSPLYPWRTPAPLHALIRWSQAYFPTLAEELMASTGKDPEWRQSGLLIFDTEQRSDALRWADQTGEAVEYLESPRLNEIEPCTTGVHSNALWLPNVAQIRNPRLLGALKSMLQGAGVGLIEHAEVISIIRQNDHVTGVKTAKGDYAAGKVVVAGGAWTSQLLEPFPLKWEITPVRGQMLLYRTPPGFLRRILLKEDCYLVPRQDGRVLVGSTVESVGFNKSATEEGKALLQEGVRHILPSLLEFPIERHWAGLRPHCSGGLPFIGPHPEIEGLYVNAGHFRNGVVSGPASARLLADIMLKRTPIASPQPYS
jgi:glycine oxidase